MMPHFAATTTVETGHSHGAVVVAVGLPAPGVRGWGRSAARGGTGGGGGERTRSGRWVLVPPCWGRSAHPYIGLSTAIAPCPGRSAHPDTGFVHRNRPSGPEPPGNRTSRPGAATTARPGGGVTAVTRHPGCWPAHSNHPGPGHITVEAPKRNSPAHCRRSGRASRCRCARHEVSGVRFQLGR